MMSWMFFFKVKGFYYIGCVLDFKIFVAEGLEEAGIFYIYQAILINIQGQGLLRSSSVLWHYFIVVFLFFSTI